MNFVVLPLVIVLVTALMAALALPLGPAAAFDAAAACLRHRHRGLDGRHRGVHRSSSWLETGPTVWFIVTGAMLLLLALGAGPTPWSALGGVAMLLVIGGSWIVGSASGDMWSPYYRISAFAADLGRASQDASAGRPPVYLEVDGIPHQAILPVGGGRARRSAPAAVRVVPGSDVRPRPRSSGRGPARTPASPSPKGASHVDAVEIDPRLARIGASSIPSGVYDGPARHRST